MNQVRHILGISGGKDSSALAIYLRNRYPELQLEYYFADTGKELAETYDFLQGLETSLDIAITKLWAVNPGSVDPFDYYLTWMYNGYLPSPKARWCTRHLKLEPFEKFVGDDPTVSYVAIRGDEDREGYISHKPNIQTIFPFRRNIWSEGVITKILDNANLELLGQLYAQLAEQAKREDSLKIVSRPINWDLDQTRKLNALLDLSVTTFNRVVFTFLKTTDYPLGKVETFPLLDNDDVITRADVFRLLDQSGLGKPKYYQEIPISAHGKSGTYFRSRSGCYFCFFQQKIEWVWLYEQHPDLFEKAKAYEKDEYTWNERETLDELVSPKRREQIKTEYLTRTANACRLKKSNKLIDILLDESEVEGCVACFV